MQREIVINALGTESRVAIIEDGRLVELMNEQSDEARIVGDLYLGKVEAVLPGIQAAFVDIGTEKSENVKHLKNPGFYRVTLLIEPSHKELNFYSASRIVFVPEKSAD